MITATATLHPTKKMESASRQTRKRTEIKHQSKHFVDYESVNDNLFKLFFVQCGYNAGLFSWNVMGYIELIASNIYMHVQINISRN